MPRHKRNGIEWGTIFDVIVFVALAVLCAGVYYMKTEGLINIPL